MFELAFWFFDMEIKLMRNIVRFIARKYPQTALGKVFIRVLVEESKLH